MISERLLRKWRREALIDKHVPPGVETAHFWSGEYYVASERILRLTQELLDQHLLKKESKN